MLHHCLVKRSEFFGQNPCNLSGPGTFQFSKKYGSILLSDVNISLLFITLRPFLNCQYPFCIFALSWSIELSHISLQNLIDSFASSITCSCLIFHSSSSYKVLLCRYCFILDLERFNFNVLADIRSFSSSITALKPLAFILYFFFISNFNLGLPFSHLPLNQS